MKQKLFTTFLAMAMLLSAAACTPQADDNTPPSASVTQGPEGGIPGGGAPEGGASMGASTACPFNMVPRAEESYPYMGVSVRFPEHLLNAILGFLFQWKVTILLVTLLAAIIVYRPFCKYICPLGATYALFNRISLYRLQVDKNKCVNCSACAKVCKMGIDPVKTPNSTECIRCGECAHACPKDAIHLGFCGKKS